MSIPGAIVVPHPPVIVPEVGHGREREIEATTQAYQAAARLAASWQPDVLLVASPHTAAYADRFYLAPGPGASGDLAAFGAPQVRLQAAYDEPLRDRLIALAQAEGLPAGTQGARSPVLDHGVLLPLYFLRQAGVTCPIVRMGLSGLSAQAHYRLGRCAAEAVRALGRRAVFVASGDLSHKLRADGPYGYAPEGPAFDGQVTAAMASGDFGRFLTFEPGFCDRAAECGLRAFTIMAGALDGLAVQPALLSYEGPFGVGYAVATFTVTGPDEQRRFAGPAQDAWVRLARLALETYVRTGRPLHTLPEGLPEALTGQAGGAFVSLHRDGQLRGCIGTIRATTPSVAQEIVQNAVSAGTQDPRFPPVRAWELSSLTYSVDVLGPAEPVSGPEALDVHRYGVIVTCGSRRGLLLPELEGVDTVREQIDIARRKAGIGADEPYTLERFEVVRHG